MAVLRLEVPGIRQLASGPAAFQAPTGLKFYQSVLQTQLLFRSVHSQDLPTPPATNYFCLPIFRYTKQLPLFYLWVHARVSVPGVRKRAPEPLKLQVFVGAAN